MNGKEYVVQINPATIAHVLVRCESQFALIALDADDVGHWFELDQGAEIVACIPNARPLAPSPTA